MAGEKLSANWRAGRERNGTSNCRDLMSTARMPAAEATAAAASQETSHAVRVGLRRRDDRCGQACEAHYDPAPSRNGRERAGTLHRIADEDEVLGRTFVNPAGVSHTGQCMAKYFVSSR